jgi:hypothetical protein
MHDLEVHLGGAVMKKLEADINHSGHCAIANFPMPKGHADREHLDPTRPSRVTSKGVVSARRDQELLYNLMNGMLSALHNSIALRQLTIVFPRFTLRAPTAYCVNR